jgi:hypothetical protein
MLDIVLLLSCPFVSHNTYPLRRKQDQVNLLQQKENDEQRLFRTTQNKINLLQQKENDEQRLFRTQQLQSNQRLEDKTDRIDSLLVVFYFTFLMSLAIS